MYVAVKGGEAAIANAHRLLAEDRRGDPAVPALTLDQIQNQLTLAVDRGEELPVGGRHSDLGDRTTRAARRGQSPAKRLEPVFAHRRDEYRGRHERSDAFLHREQRVVIE